MVSLNSELMFDIRDDWSPAEWLLLQSSVPPHRWTPARGTLEEGEEEMTTAVREVREETGFLLQDLWLYDDLKSEVAYKENIIKY